VRNEKLIIILIIAVRGKNSLVGGKQTKFVRMLFHLPEYDRHSWQISRYKFFKLGL